jgi:hypothetical protein
MQDEGCYQEVFEGRSKEKTTQLELNPSKDESCDCSSWTGASIA